MSPQLPFNLKQSVLPPHSLPSLKSFMPGGDRARLTVGVPTRENAEERARALSPESSQLSGEGHAGVLGAAGAGRPEA